jgi:cell division control protein 24
MSEEEFSCYGPYCANYLDAITMVNEQMPNLLVSPVFSNMASC